MNHNTTQHYAMNKEIKRKSSISTRFNNAFDFPQRQIEQRNLSHLKRYLQSSYTVEEKL